MAEAGCQFMTQSRNTENAPDAEPSDYGPICSTYGAGFMNVGLMAVYGFGFFAGSVVLAVAVELWWIAIPGLVIFSIMTYCAIRNSKVKLQLYERGLEYRSAAGSWGCPYEAIAEVKVQQVVTILGETLSSHLHVEGQDHRAGALAKPFRAREAILNQMQLRSAQQQECLQQSVALDGQAKLE